MSIAKLHDEFPTFLYSNKFGIYEVCIERDVIKQNLLEDTVRELDVKSMQVNDEQSVLIFPKWDKLIKKLSFHVVSKYDQGISTLRDVEWTKGSIPLKGFNAKSHDWHIGHSGNSIFISDYQQEDSKQRSYVLTDGHDFNYWFELQLVQPNVRFLYYKVFYVVFDQETQKDALCLSLMHLNYFHKKTVKRADLRFGDNW